MIAEQRAEMIQMLEADTYFDDIHLFKEDDGLTEADLDKALKTLKTTGGKVGLSAELLTPAAMPQPDNGGGFVFEDIVHVFRILEFPKLNRGASGTGKLPTAVAEQMIRVLVGGETMLSATGPLQCVQPGITPADHPKYPGVEIAFATGGVLSATLTAVATPVITADAETGELTLTCATAGAFLWYTTDGKRPSPRNATLYTAPFTPAAGLTVKVRARLDGYLASPIATHNT